MTKHLPNYIHSLRKRWALTQRDLAFLLAISETHLREIEHGKRNPTQVALIGSEIVFGRLPRNAFPALYEQMETEILSRAATLYERLEDRTDDRSVEKRRLLLDMIQRTEPIRTSV